MSRSRVVQVAVALVLAALIGAACAVDREPVVDARAAAEPGQTDSPADAETGSDAGTEPAAATETTIENYPDAQTRALAARARERRPVANSALPPRHLEPERHPESLVDRNRIVSGGPTPDGIPSIDQPTFSPVEAIDWLADDEPVAVLTIDGQTRIYPAQILIWHEIVNDDINGRPVAMTYCPLCNSVVAFDATVTGPDGGDLILDFGTSGALYQSALVMYDRQTESLWTHFDGVAVIGTLLGANLDILPAAMVSWVDAREAHPEAAVLDRPADSSRPYGTVPYPNYETAPPASAFVTVEPDPRLAAKERVVGINLGDRRIAVDRRALQQTGLRKIQIGAGEPDLVVLWEPGTASALDGENIEDGVAVGSVGVFLATTDEDADEPLRLSVDATGAVVDDRTGSTWNVRGQAIAGPLAGRTLLPLAHLDTFWFAWSGYHPDTELIG
ncbi:MAG: DUF3179 domain-containing protein [Actinomycetota bacterium]